MPLNVAPGLTRRFPFSVKTDGPVFMPLPLTVRLSYGNRGTVCAPPLKSNVLPAKVCPAAFPGVNDPATLTEPVDGRVFEKSLNVRLPYVAARTACPGLP